VHTVYFQSVRLLHVEITPHMALQTAIMSLVTVFPTAKHLQCRTFNCIYSNAYYCELFRSRVAWGQG